MIVTLPPSRALDLRVFVDVSILEIFLDSRFALTTRVYPSLPTPYVDAQPGISFTLYAHDSHL